MKLEALAQQVDVQEQRLVLVDDRVTKLSDEVRGVYLKLAALRWQLILAAAAGGAVAEGAPDWLRNILAMVGG